MSQEYQHDITPSEAICFALFRATRPHLAQLPHILYRNDSRIAHRIASETGCRLGVWPHSPQYDSSGELDSTLPDGAPLPWEQWSNVYNQRYVIQLSGENSGAYATMYGIIVDVTSAKNLSALWEPNASMRDAVWLYLSDLVAISKWAAVPSDEGDFFALVCRPDYSELVSSIESYALDIEIHTAHVTANGGLVQVHGFLRDMTPAPEWVQSVAKLIRASR